MKKPIIILIIVFVVVFLIYRFLKNRKVKGASAERIVEVSPTNTCPYNDNTFPLKKCSGGSNVVDLQKSLNKILESYNQEKLVEDGNFGSKTESALKSITGLSNINLTQLQALRSANPEEYKQFMLTSYGATKKEDAKIVDESTVNDYLSNFLGVMTFGYF